MSSVDNLHEYFKFRPVKAAKVSEVSEATASSDVPAEERVNFHIGNPVQDISLSSAYLRLALGIPVEHEHLSETEIQSIVDYLNLSVEDSEFVQFLSNLIKKSAPYMPRGGYNAKNPHSLVSRFYQWLRKEQPEPLAYDLGESSGKREILLSTGGVFESLRILLHAVSYYSAAKKILVVQYGCTLPDHLTTYQNIQYLRLDVAEDTLPVQLSAILSKNATIPTYLLLGKITSEITRRKLRQLSLQFPLFIVETNDAPNHLSLAREAKMMNRVLRILSPGIFAEPLKNSSVSFIAGNPELVKMMETVQFQLKGTPSATEVEMLSYIIERKNLLLTQPVEKKNIILKPRFENAPFVNFSSNHLQERIKKHSEKLEYTILSRSKRIEQVTERYTAQAIQAVHVSENYSSRIALDVFDSKNSKELLDDFIRNVDNESWQQDLINSFLTVFLRHHPEYKPNCVQLVSGSSRTGLGMLGFHCGFREVIIPDLSWTYEHCFPKVHVVPLTDSLEIDVTGIIDKAKSLLALDPHWAAKGAIVLNNPHNATGKKFNSASLERLISWALQKGIFIIDDLSYQNVAPHNKLLPIATIRQLTDIMVQHGYVTQEQSDKVITVHSLSKTDSLAGARQSVIEIRHKEIFQRFKAVNKSISPNLSAVYLTYMFYRNNPESVDAYWRLRNRIFLERMQAIESAVQRIPIERNVFDITIVPPQGSMYPQMIIRKLPDGLSLDWLASGLARQGIGMVPLSTFARTEKGFEIARTTFRLTLGGSDNAEILSHKTRRVLIDINRLIAEEASNYKKKTFQPKGTPHSYWMHSNSYATLWEMVEKQIAIAVQRLSSKYPTGNKRSIMDEALTVNFKTQYIPERLSAFRLRLQERLTLLQERIQRAEEDRGNSLVQHLSYEFEKDNLYRKEALFNRRLFDRTVHPTQMYSIRVEKLFEQIIRLVLQEKIPANELVQQAALELVHEFNGMNVAITSSEEQSELLLDLDSLIAVEQYTKAHADRPLESMLSFWGDWDGSNRPSGQGHSLISAVLIENVARQASLLQRLLKVDTTATVPDSLLHEIEKLTESNKKFSALLQQITSLTHQLEKRYRGILPFNLKPGKLRRLGMKLHIAKDPLTSMWQHNDRLERRMIDLRQQRKETLEYYFDLNKQLRKALKSLLPYFKKNAHNKELCREALQFHDLMKRFIITPRIHQKLITAQDQFAIDTTVNNIHEINEIAGRFGLPGMVLALQISMSTKPEALISLDRKMRTRREQILRESTCPELPHVWLIPLFEDQESVKGIENYLHKLWDYAFQSRRINQETAQRFAEIICEVFVAGSDLSQQVGQAAGMHLYKEAKHTVTRWLAEKGLTQSIRMKMGSGEPMQRQGGYYSPYAGCPAFTNIEKSEERFARYLKASTKKSTEYAVTPMMGIFSGGDLRTFQSAISERLRYLPAAEVAQLYHHVFATQQFYRNEIIRAAEPLTETRLHFKTRGFKELERLTLGKTDPLYLKFINLVTDNFRQILYGREEDVVGIHIISYFIARTTPPLRDRPLIRPGQGVGGNAGRKILERIAETIPLAKYGSLLRAIAHNQSQTAILGISQLTTGLFRALDSFVQLPEVESEALAIIEDRILPQLPVYEILHSVRIYHDVELTYLNRMEKAFPAGNSAFLALREDIDAMNKYIVLFQKELLRRHGLNVSDFFDQNGFISDLLPTLRPDLAVLLQANLFNTEIQTLLEGISGSVDDSWINEVTGLLKMPAIIGVHRAKAWKLLDIPVFLRVASFVELAIALHSLSSENFANTSIPASGKMKIPAEMSNFYRSSGDDTMKQFLTAAFEYLSVLSEGMIEVPTNIIRALKEVERIITIEEQALTAKEQELLRFYLLQIARLAGENG